MGAYEQTKNGNTQKKKHKINKWIKNVRKKVEIRQVKKSVPLRMERGGEWQKEREVDGWVGG